ncbi:phage baseplate assembly protein V, partial [Prevotella denticola]|uniref:phage baseplate assembly protein V n=1 Tax=Prevotella denticola TaxID=28129 RepID=UPI001C5D9221
GSSKDVRSNRGFVFIPEVGDQVLLGFRHGDPARPYVMGSLFNGVTGGGGGQGNNCKSLTTRSGSSLKLDDSAGSVTLHDKGGVKMNFDGAGNSTLNAKATHSVNAGSNASVNVGKGVCLLNMDSGGNITLDGNSTITIKVGSSKITIDTTSITVEAANVNVKGKTRTVVGPSADLGVTVSAGGPVDIVGTPVNINQEKGGLVNIK